MKKSLLLVVLLFAMSFVKAQENSSYFPAPKYPFLFKALAPVNNNAPEWMHKMYSSNPNIFEIEQAYLTYYQSNDFVKTLHTQNYKHLMKFVYQNNWMDTDGTINVKEFSEDKGIQERITAQNQALQVANWNPIGPFNAFKDGGSEAVTVQANVYTIAQSISNPLIMLCGTETGAVFKSIDKGENWFPLGDSFFNDGIVSVEIDPTNSSNMFVGSNNNIYKSTDGGTTWTQVLNVSSLRIYEFTINPNNNQLIFAAGNKGLYRSIDGGTTWIQVFSDTCWDVKFKTNDTQTLFLLKSNPTLKLTEFYKSSDGGLTFTLKSDGWFVPTATSSIEGARMGVTNADANRIYVVLLGNVDDYATDVNFIGVYRSDNAGESWIMPYDQNNDGVPNNNTGGPYSVNHWCFSCPENAGGTYNQGFYNLAIDVSDTDPNKFLMGMMALFKSENGGVTYTRWGGFACDGCTPYYYRHPDHQDILINGNDVFVATDGGIDLYDANLNVIKTLNKGINGSDNWGFGQGWNEDVVTAGRYHNGNAVYHENYGEGKFIHLGGSEDATGYVNLGNNYIVYHSDVPARKISSIFSTATTATLNLTMFPNQAYFTRKKSKIVYNPSFHKHMYLGKDNNLWKSEDGGNSFSLIQSFGTISANIITGIEISRQNPSIMFVAQRFGTVNKLWKTQDGGINWTQIPLPSTQIDMFISLNENNTLFIGFGSGFNTVYKSTDLGNSWLNLTTPTIYQQGVSDIVAQLGTNDGIYITMAGNNKIYYRNASLTDWQVFNQGLPLNFRFMGILPFYKSGEIRISGTRGFWKSPMFEPSLPIAQPMVANKTVDCHRTHVQFDDYSVLNHTGASWNWSFPGASTVSSTTVRNPLVTYTTPGMYNVSLTITDSNGNSSSKTVTNMIEVVPSTCVIETDALKVLEMNSSNQSIVSDELNYGNTNNLTFTGWIKPNGIQVNWAGLLTVGSNFVFGFNTNNQLQFHPQWWANTGLFVEADKWNYVAIRYTPTQVTIFLNDKKWTVSGTFDPININKIRLGKHLDWNDRTFKGQMEEFAIWNRALSDDEIYLGRHLIKMNNTDSNLLAYYQFNNILNNGGVYDKKNTNDLFISGTITFPISTAPIGVGSSQLMTVNAAGNYNFSLANANLNFGSSVPNGKVVMSKLNVNPNEAPNTNLVSNEYWILNNYGTNATFSGLTDISLATATDLSTMSPSMFTVYKRESNGYLQSSWIQDASATNISSSSILFPGLGLNQSYQWYLGSNTPLGINTINTTKTFMVYPNPYIQGQQLYFEGLKEPFKFTLYDVEGKLLLTKNIVNETINLEKSFAKGVYFYRIETQSKMYNGKLIIE